MAVFVARLISMEETQVDFEVKLRSLARLVERALPSSVFGKLVDIRNSEVTGVISSDADTAARALRALRRMGVKKSTAGDLAAAVGISLDATDIDRLPQAHEEARIALSFANKSRPVMQFHDIELSEFLIRGADRAAYRLIPGWARHFSDPDDERTRDLLLTIRAFADASLNVKHAARLLGVHTNTVYFRLNRINKLTGVDPRTYSGTSALITALRLLECNGHMTAPLYKAPVGSKFSSRGRSPASSD
jgi:sugar diacid utilization regulator